MQVTHKTIRMQYVSILLRSKQSRVLYFPGNFFDSWTQQTFGDVTRSPLKTATTRTPFIYLLRMDFVFMYSTNDDIFVIYKMFMVICNVSRYNRLLDAQTHIQIREFNVTHRLLPSFAK